jgi:endogenous inhibitor of DNA gyrase (YacG/DUF329 family)
VLTRVKCPWCRTEVPWEGNPFRPFCSERCQTLDLGAWAAERYRVPGETVEPSPEAGSGDPDPEDGPTS